MAQGGWIKLYRSLLNDPVWTQTNAEQKAVAIVILLSANREAKQWVFNGQKITLEPGQFVTSAQALSEAAGGEFTRRKIRTALNKLEKLGFCSIQAANHGTLINVVNWAFYQGAPQAIGADAASKTANNSTNKTANRSESESQGTQEVRPTVDGKAASSSTSKAAKESTTIKKYKKYKNSTLVVQVIEYLNQVAGKKFDPKKDAARGPVIARLNEPGHQYSLEDFKRVIDNKTAEWTGKKNSEGTPMTNFLKPDTLFSKSHFENYLNEAPAKPLHSEPPAPEDPQARLRGYVGQQVQLYGGLSATDAAAMIVNGLSDTDIQVDPQQVLAIVQEYRKTGDTDAAKHRE